MSSTSQLIIKFPAQKKNSKKFKFLKNCDLGSIDSGKTDPTILTLNFFNLTSTIDAMKSTERIHCSELITEGNCDGDGFVSNLYMKHLRFSGFQKNIKTVNSRGTRIPVPGYRKNLQFYFLGQLILHHYLSSRITSVISLTEHHKSVTEKLSSKTLQRAVTMISLLTFKQMS